MSIEPVKIKIKRDRLGGVSKPVEPPPPEESDEDAPLDEGDELEIEEVIHGEAGAVDVSDGDEGDDKNAWLKFSSKDTILAAESDSSDDEGPKNRIGNVPLNWYDEYDHIGYDVTGKKIGRKPRQDNIDAMLAGKDKNQVTIYDPLNDERVVLSEEELNVINRIRKGKFPHKDFDPYAEYDMGPTKVDIHPLGNTFEPKSRFIPSKWEAKKIIRLVHSIRNGWIKLDEEKEDPDAPFLLWKDDEQVDTSNKMGLALPAPKLALPGHGESYNPPPEYLPSEEEIQQWNDMDPEDRPFLPRAYNSMREIPGYAGFMQERFERCLDLYMCPRTRIARVKMDPQALIPKLPKPEELRPFPSVLTLEYKGHTGNVRSISLDPRGQWLVSGGDDGTVRLWEVSSARCFREWKFDEVIECVAWNPNPVFPLIAVVFGTKILILDSHTGGEEEAEAINTLLAEGRTAALTQNQSEQGADDDTKKRRRRINADWHLVTKAGAVAQITQVLATAAKEGEQPESSGQVEEGETKNEPVFPFANPLMSITTKDVTSKVSYRALINVKMRINRVVWHHKGDYFASVSPQSSSFTSVLIHRISQSKSQTPFSKNKGLIQSISFHPSKPFFFVASQRNVRIYNLQTQLLVKKLLAPAKWISSMSIHPSGDHVLLGSYDRRVCWFDLDLSSTPFKTLKYHTKAVRQVQFHQTYPLFSTCSDDGNVHIFHAKVFSDLLTNPLLVPVKLLKVQAPIDNLGVLDCKFHPSQPWLFTSGSDNIIRLFT